MLNPINNTIRIKLINVFFITIIGFYDKIISMKTPLNTLSDLNECIKRIDRTRDKSLISLIAGSGIYIDEIRMLTLNDISNDFSSLQTTGKRPRQLIISEFAKPLLKQWILEKPKTSHDKLFFSLTGNLAPLSQRGIDNIIRKWADTIAIDFNYQKLRTFTPEIQSNKTNPDHPSNTNHSNHSYHEKKIIITRFIPLIALVIILVKRLLK
jgi:integrase